MINLYTKDVGQLYLPLPLHILSVGRFSALGNMVVFDGAPAFGTAAWPLANRAIYMPVALPSHFTLARFFWVNGTSAAGNVDIGLYDSAGNRLLSTGTTARAGTSTVQYAGVTDQTFPAGKYYLALVSSSTAAGGYVSTAVDDAVNAKACGVLQEDLGGTVLPATMTPATYTSTDLFVFGFSQSDTL